MQKNGKKRRKMEKKTAAAWGARGGVRTGHCRGRNDHKVFPKLHTRGASWGLVFVRPLAALRVSMYGALQGFRRRICHRR